MLQSLVITLREGVEAALVIGIVLTYLRRTGQEAWNRVVYGALALAIGASLVGAFVVDRLQITEEAYEGWLLLAGCGFVFTMVVWMWRTGRHLKKHVETRLEEISARPGSGRAVALFLFVFLMVLREGIETVLFLSAISLETTAILNFTGGLIGLGLAVFLGIGFVKGSLHVNLPKFFRITTAILIIVGLQLLVSSVHEFSEAQILPGGPRTMSIVGPLVNNNAFFFLVIVGLTLVLLGVEGWKARNPEGPEGVPLGTAERRLLRAEQSRQRFWLATASSTAVAVLILISAEFVYSRANQSLSSPLEASVEGGEVRIPVTALADGKLNRYRLDVEGREVRFLAIREPGGEIRVALDACLICGPQGYYQDGPNVVCANCSAAIYIPSIGLAGGCNPVPLEHGVEGGEVVIPQPALAESTKHFH